MASPHRDRVAALAARAERDRESFAPPADPPDEERALELLREGVGEALSVYVDARSGDWDRFGENEFADLERALNDYLALYARCYGVDADPDVTVRQAAEALLDTRDLRDVARIVTGVPDRETG